MKKPLLTLTLLIIMLAAFAQTGPVSNITVEQRLDGSGLFDIHFDLGGTGMAYNIQVEVSLDGGNTYTQVPFGDLAGDLQFVVPGSEKHIIWDALGSFPDVYSDQAKLRITAEEPELPTPETPIVQTDDAFSIKSNSAFSGGIIISSGGWPIIEKGLCWSTEENPTIEDNITEEGGGSASFISQITDLEDGTLYYVRAYATNLHTTGYGPQKSFYTSTLPEVLTHEVSAVTHQSAQVSGDVVFDGYADVTARGIVWSTTELPTTEDHEGMSIDDGGTGTFTGELTGLEPNTTYYARAYATNNAGTAYGGQLSFVTTGFFATVNIDHVASTSAFTADVFCEVVHDGGTEISMRGVCWGTSPNPTFDDDYTFDGAGTGSYISSIEGLTPGQTYYVRAYAINDAGIGFGENAEFVAGEAIEIITKSVVSIRHIVAQSGGNIPHYTGNDIIQKGVVWSTSVNPTIDNNDGMTDDGGGAGEFTSVLEGLEPLTQYYARAYVINDVGTSYGNQQNFTTLNVVTDIDDNIYPIVIIGNQEWMAENLRVTKYNNGDVIPTGKSNAEWQNTTTGAYAIYPYDLIDGLTSAAEVVVAYGKLYNWYAVDDVRGLCPEGWSVPSDADWSELHNYLGSQGFPNNDVTGGAGNALKSCRQVGHHDGGDCNTSEHPRWNSHSTHSGFDEFGFSALPGGQRSLLHGSFNNLGAYGFWWSSAELSSAHAWTRYMYHQRGYVLRTNRNKVHGFSLRCVRSLD